MSVRDITIGDTFDMKFTTRAFATGIPTTMTGTPTIEAYPGNSTTQITAGITLTYASGFDGVAGLCNVRVVATVGNGFAADTDYALVIAGTAPLVDGVSVLGEVIGHFSTSRSAAAVDLANATDGLGAIKAETALIVADTAEIGTAGAGLTNIGTIATCTTVTNAVTLPTIPTDWITADGIAANAIGSAEIAASALDGKGDWNIGKTGYALTTQDWNVGKTGYALSAAGVDDIWDEPLAGHTTGGTSGKALNNAAAFIVADGTCQATGQTSTNIRIAAGESATDEIFTNDEIVITGGTGAGESALIIAYDGTNKDCTVSPALVVTCDATSTYEIVPALSHAENLGAPAAASINTEVLDVLNNDTFAEPAQGAPAATTTLVDKIGFLYKVLRNRKTSTSTTISIFNDDTTTVDHKRTISDNGTTYDEEEIVTGP